jgi:uncharacterized membrane protein
MLVTSAVGFSGPLPPPALLQQYNLVFPGAAERIVAMAEREATHRQDIERGLVELQITDSQRRFSESRFGQICALLITLSGMGVGAYTALHGHEIAGSILGVGGIGGIVTTFILGRPKQQQQPEVAANTHEPQRGRRGRRT